MWWSLLLPALAAPVDAPVHTGQVAEGDYAVVIGVEDYAFLPDVPHARADAQAVRTWLQASRGVPTHRIELLTDASKEQIEAALGRAREQVGDAGTLWVYWAGHGAAAPEGGGRLLLGVDTMADPEVFSTRALSVDGLEASLGEVPHAVLWLDTCYAGTGRDGQSLLPGTRFAVPTYAKQAPGEVLRWTAAKPGQLSTAHPSGHGAFTWASLRALQGEADGAVDGRQDGAVTANEAQIFVGRALADAGIRSQTPTMDGDASTVLVTGLPARAPAPATAPAPAAVPMPRPVVKTLGPEFPTQRVETPTKVPVATLTLLGLGSAAGLGTASVTRSMYVNDRSYDGTMDTTVYLNRAAGAAGIGFGAAFVYIATKSVLERQK